MRGTFLHFVVCERGHRLRDTFLQSKVGGRDFSLRGTFRGRVYGRGFRLHIAFMHFEVGGCG